MCSPYHGHNHGRDDTKNDKDDDGIDDDILMISNMSKVYNIFKICKE